MKDDITKRFGFTHITSVTNSANIKLFSIPVANYNLKGLESKKYSIYTGNIGMVNNTYWLFDAAKILKARKRDDIKIVLVGEGQWKDQLVTKVKAEGITNFILLGSMPKNELVPLIQNAFVSLVPLKGNPILDTSSPNKFFESLAAGVPVIQNTNGWMKDFLMEHQLGFTLDPNDPEALADLLIDLESRKVDLKIIGDKAKKIAKEQFDKDILADKMLNAIKSSI
jgi:glycosyltransferase involved in cell wall biosynthesis